MNVANIYRADIVAEERARVARGLRARLPLPVPPEPDIEVVGEAEDGVQAVRMARTLHPDVVLMEVRTPNLHGLETTRRICGTGSSARVPVCEPVG